MASAIYYDSIGSRTATLTDGTTTSGSFTSSNVLSDELRATDGSITDVVGGWAVDEGLQFNFGGTVSPNFCAIYSTVATSNDIRIQRDNSASGAFNGIFNDITDISIGWNIRSLTVLPMQYWTINSIVGSLTGISEVFFGEKLAFPVEPTANIITAHNFGTEEVKAVGSNRFYFSKHSNYKVITLKLDHLTSANKTSLETFANTVTNREPFIYSEDDTTGPFHWVRLVKPLQFKTVLPDIYSTQLILRELIG
jgi:hypothetical protein